MSMVGYLPARDAQGMQDNRVIRLLREDALRAVTLGAGGGSSGGNIPFTGCPTCEPGPALAACGFGP